VSKYQRPWWLLVNKPAGLITTVQEQAGPGERTFIIHGEPLVKGLAWLIWGPVAALFTIGLLTGIAVAFNIREQSGITRFLFVVAMLGLPALTWGMATIAANRLAAKHLEAERRAEAQECIIRLNRERGEFCYQTMTSPKEEILSFDHIRRVRVKPAIGARDVKSMRLTLDTDNGTIVLLNEALGTRTQKIDLAHEIQTSIEDYTRK